jgi:hypothetical protein
MVFTSKSDLDAFVKTESGQLPKNVNYVSQSGFPVFPSALRLKNTTLKNLPLVIFINSKGVVNYLSEGYRIGIGDELLLTIR